MPKPRILIVEDESLVGLSLQRKLEVLGYEVSAVVGSGEEAIQQARLLQPDLALMDIMLGGELDGVEAARQIRTQLDMPIIYLTAYSDDNTIERAKFTSPFGYLLKPLQERELQIAIEMALHRHQLELALRQSEGEVRRRNWELSLLNRIIAAAASSTNQELLLETVCRELGGAFEAARVVALLLNDEGTGAIEVSSFQADDQVPVHSSASAVESTPTYLSLLSQRTPQFVEQAQHDARLAALRSTFRELSVESLLVLPLVIEDQIVGGLSLTFSQPRRISDHQLDLARRVGEQLSSALVRIRLARTSQRLIAAVEQANESIIITDTDHLIVYVNPAFERISGYPRHEAAGQRISFLNSGKQTDLFYQDLWSTLNAGQLWHGRLSHRRQDGNSYTNDATISPVRNEEGKIVNFVGVLRDVTRELQLEEQYYQAQKMQAVGLLAGGIAHDFNNLLTPIIGFTEILQLELLPDQAESLDLVGRIRRSSIRAADLIRQLLVFSRKQSTEPEIVNLNELIVDSIKLLSRLIEEAIEIETHLAPDLWSVQVDPTQFEQVLFNLAVNARDAMPNGGRLIIETANAVLDDDYVTTHLGAKAGDYVLLSVSDTGVGMNQEVQAHIFDPFFTTKAEGQGTGLGLANVFGIVERSHGYIRVYSELERGTTLKIYLPRHDKPAQLSPPSGKLSERLHGSETVLLVEDETSVRELVAYVLNRHGYTVLDTTNGEEALGLAQDYQAQIHLLLTDTVMPKMGGPELIKHFMGFQPSAKILLMSGYTDKMLPQVDLRASDVEFISKPFSTMELVRKVREVLDS
jgi:PAS domain S-box-containing protein